MESKIKLYRVLLNILFYVFYVLLASIAFSFIFPTILVILGQEVLDPSNPIFDSIQIGIIVLVLILTLMLRKYCYLPIVDNTITIKIETKNVEAKKVEIKNVETKKEKNNLLAVDEKEIPVKSLDKEKIKKTPELDIKIGKEIK